MSKPTSPQTVHHLAPQQQGSAHVRPPYDPRARTRARGQAGFTTAELIVAMAILAIVIALVVPSFLGARQETAANLVRSQAVTYGVAVEEFQRSHANRAPVLGAPADWPDAATGPIDKLGRPLRANDADSTTKVLVSSSMPGAIPDGYTGAMQYERLGETQWRIRVFATTGGDLTEVCRIGSGEEGTSC